MPVVLVNLSTIVQMFRQGTIFLSGNMRPYHVFRHQIMVLHILLAARTIHGWEGGGNESKQVLISAEFQFYDNVDMGEPPFLKLDHSHDINLLGAAEERF